jgi:hypothetical protein
MDYIGGCIMVTAVICVFVLTIVALYYRLSICGVESKRIACIMKIILLIITFVLAIIKKDFLTIGKLALGGTSTVATLVGFEIADALLELREQKQQKRNR